MNEFTQKGPLGWMASNSVAANLLMIVLLIGGLIMALNIKQEVFPEFSPDTVVVSVSYPGASPEEVEKGIILPVEEAVEGLEGIESISSTASEGSGSITIEALKSADIIRLWQEVEKEVDRIDSLPDEAEDPKVSIAERKRGVLDLVLWGSENDIVLRDTAENIKDRLLQSPDITQVELSGSRDREIHIEIPMANLRKYNLKIEDIASLVKASSVEVGAGNLRTKGGDILVRVKDLKEEAQEYKKLPVITTDSGENLLLEDIAVIKEGFEDSFITAGFNGKNALLIDVYRIGDQTPIQVSEAAKKIMLQINSELPGDLKLSILRDRSDVFKDRGTLLLKNALLGLALVFILLALFLEMRLAFWVSLGIPVSFLGSFLIFPFTDFSINMITMFAFIITLGIVVDDAIVVGENIYSSRQQGLSFFESSVYGVKEVATPVFFSVATNIVTFLPLFFVPGFMGKIFKYIPVVVSCVFLMSLIESLLILPAHLGHQKALKKKGFMHFIANLQNRFSTAFESFVETGYGRFLDFAIAHRYNVIAFCLALLLGFGGFIKSGRMGMTLFPSVESDYSFASATLPVGSSHENVRNVEKILIDAAKKVIEENGGEELSQGVFSLISENSISIRTYLTAADKRPISTTAFSNKWREYTGNLTGIETIGFESDRGGPGSGKALTIRLSHPDKDILEQAGKDLAKKLEGYDGVSDIDDGSASGKRQIDLSILPAGKRMGLTSREIANQVRNAVYGKEALSFLRGQDEIGVVVKLPENERQYEATIENLVLNAPKGEILLRDAAEIGYSRAFTSINREEGMRVVSVTADIFPRSQADILSSNLKKDVLPQLTEKYPLLTYSFEGRQAEIRDSVESLIQGLLFALLVIYALLAVPFKSYFQPLIIMLCIPFGIIGAIIGHLVMGYSLSVMSIFGIVALSGVVVNGSLVLIDFTNRKTREGESPEDAVHHAARQRFRPIMLTTLTTFFGLMPMILETSRQARFLIPMAISLGFGVLFATIITLVMVPCFYLMTEDIKKAYKLVFKPDFIKHPEKEI
ncbi:MAG: efflux RND transporter permease subunit [Desulfobacteraceae bacterium]|nr:efflux RND transporter permease subunit [Desulfobacteraceae bacterium]